MPKFMNTDMQQRSNYYRTAAGNEYLFFHEQYTEVNDTRDVEYFRKHPNFVEAGHAKEVAQPVHASETHDAKSVKDVPKEFYSQWKAKTKQEQQQEIETLCELLNIKDVPKPAKEDERILALYNLTLKNGGKQ